MKKVRHCAKLAASVTAPSWICCASLIKSSDPFPRNSFSQRCVQLVTKNADGLCFISTPGQTTHTSCNGASSAVKKVQKTTNYASVECGAKILASNPEAKVCKPACCICIMLFCTE